MNMLETYYRNLTPTEKEFAINRLAEIYKYEPLLIEKTLDYLNPQMAIKDQRIVMHRNFYQRLASEIHRISQKSGF